MGRLLAKKNPIVQSSVNQCLWFNFFAFLLRFKVDSFIVGCRSRVCAATAIPKQMMKNNHAMATSIHTFFLGKTEPLRSSPYRHGSMDLGSAMSETMILNVIWLPRVATHIRAVA